MGSAASVPAVSEEEELEAFQALKQAYGKLDPNMDEVHAFEHLREVYIAHLKQQQLQGTAAAAAATPHQPPTAAPTEGPTPLLLAQATATEGMPTTTPTATTADWHPLVAEALRMTEEEKEDLARRVLEAAIEEDKRRGTAAKGAGAAADYSKSFAGTEQDTKAEKEFEAVVRGTDTASGGSTNTAWSGDPLLAPCPPQAYADLRHAGKWRRFVSVSGCYLYVHSLTHEVVALKPDDYIEEQDGAEDAGGAVDPAHRLYSCHISEVPRVLKEVIEVEHLTPLFLDTSPERKLSSFFSYKAITLDVSALSVGYAKTGLKTSDLMEKARQKTVAALKAGQLLVLDLGSVTVAHANFKAKLCKKEVFPLEIFQEGGKKLFSPNVGPRYEKLFHDEDKDQNQCMVKSDGFSFAVLSSLPANEYESLLGESIPLGYMKPIYVRS